MSNQHDDTPHAEARAGLATAVTAVPSGFDPAVDPAVDPVGDPDHSPDQEG